MTSEVRILVPCMYFSHIRSARTLPAAPALPILFALRHRRSGSRPIVQSLLLAQYPP